MLLIVISNLKILENIFFKIKMKDERNKLEEIKGIRVVCINIEWLYL